MGITGIAQTLARKVPKDKWRTSPVTPKSSSDLHVGPWRRGPSVQTQNRPLSFCIFPGHQILPQKTWFDWQLFLYTLRMMFKKRKWWPNTEFLGTWCSDKPKCCFAILLSSSTTRIKVPMGDHHLTSRYPHLSHFPLSCSQYPIYKNWLIRFCRGQVSHFHPFCSLLTIIYLHRSEQPKFSSILD